jgi:hypothetical protein
MFAVFTLNDGRSVRVDTDAVLAIEDLDAGCRIFIGSGTFDVKETTAEVLEELGEDEDEEEDDDED